MAEPIGSHPRPARMVQRLLTAASFASLVILAAPTAHVLACSCAQMTPAEALSNADVAFVGVVAAIDDPSVGLLVNTGDPLHYSFAVEEAIKGELAGRVEVLSARESSSCGQEFALAQRWRVFAYVDETGHLQSHLCSRNELLAEGVPIPAPIPSALTLPPLPVLIALGVGLVVAGFSVWAFTRGARSAS